MRRGLIVAGLLLVLVAVGTMIVRKEQVLRTGLPVYLRLVPVDPRSLIQGDYMALRYEIESQAPPDRLVAKGRIVIRRDERGVGSYVRLDDGAPLAEGECFLVYRKRGQPRLGAESFFFEEGQGPRYAQARYALLRVAPSGDSVLVDLRGENLEELPRLEKGK
jgi:uncharacterized membrane-anchored protein